MPDFKPSSKRPHNAAMRAASARVLRTSRLLLLPAVALTLAACNENPISAAAAEAGQQVAELRQDVQRVFEPDMQVARNDDRDDRDGRGDRWRDDERDGERDDGRDGDRDDEDDDRGYRDRDGRDDDDRRARRADRDDERYRDRGGRDDDDDDRGGRDDDDR